jgi:hypothetical protein
LAVWLGVSSASRIAAKCAWAALLNWTVSWLDPAATGCEFDCVDLELDIAVDCATGCDWFALDIAPTIWFSSMNLIGRSWISWRFLFPAFSIF